MNNKCPIGALYTDLYELTMMQGYHRLDKDVEVVFDVFFRSQPYSGGYSVFAGLEDVLNYLENVSFDDADIEYLSSLGQFYPDFLDHLRSFKFSGDVYAMKEGDVVFPDEPLLRIHARFGEAQLIETMLLNIVNFQSLIATKAARIYQACRGGTVLEMGMRRAQGPNGAISAARAAYIGGAAGTSNTEAARRFDLPVRGTMAHSWVMSFESEEDSFRSYAELYPDRCIFLIDTYDTLGSGITNAITVGHELQERGKSFGVRLDSGDLEYLSQKVRARLDEAGLTGAKIAVSNELDEWIIHQLVTDGAPIDLWGVGTHMVTGGDQASFSGVYKLSARRNAGELLPVMKISDNPAKASNPGVKQVYRFLTEHDEPVGDLIAFCDEPEPDGSPVVFHHPVLETQRYRMRGYARAVPLLQPVMRDGKRLQTTERLDVIRDHSIRSVSQLHHTYRRLINPHVYKVSLSSQLKKMKLSMIQERTGE